MASITRPPAWLGGGGGRPPRAAIVASTVKWHYSSRAWAPSCRNRSRRRCGWTR
ncbi:MAG: hypothetical protein U1F35_08985 [Steroidobacteraceae bacterium]